MRRSNEIHSKRSVSLVLLLPSATLAAAILPMGCESAPPVRQAPEQRRAVERAPEPSSPAVSEAASELALIAERDVQAFLDRQQRPEPTREQPPQRPTRAEREILWNLPDESQHEPIEVDLPDVRSSELFLLPDEADAETASAQVRDRPTDDEPIERDRIRELIVELSKSLYREATYADMPLRELMLIAATTIVTPDRALQPEAIPALTSRERELLREFQAFFTHIGQQLDGSRIADDVLLHALDELRASLRTEPQLYLDTMALCTRVGGFGDYDPFSRNSFLAHAEQQAVLYLEIAGFTSELNQKNQWVTEISLQLTIYSDRDGIPVWREDWQTAVDVSRNKRQDFFMVQILTLPKALSVGRYHLKVRVRDERSGAEAEGSIPFEMVADPKLAAGAGR